MLTLFPMPKQQSALMQRTPRRCSTSEQLLHVPNILLPDQPPAPAAALTCPAASPVASSNSLRSDHATADTPSLHGAAAMNHQAVIRT